MADLFKYKIKSKTGASLILALLFFVLCAIIGSIVLTAATAAAGRVKQLKSSARAEYSLYSAAEYLQGVLTKAVFFADARQVEMDPDVTARPSINKTEDIINMLAYDLYSDTTILEGGGNYKSIDGKITTKLTSENFFTVSILQRGQYEQTWITDLTESGVKQTNFSISSEKDEIDDILVTLEIFKNYDIKVTLYDEQGDRKLFLWLYASDLEVDVQKMVSGYQIDAFMISWPSSEISVTPIPNSN